MKCCAECGAVIDRDLNAARNVRPTGVSGFGGITKTPPWRPGSLVIHQSARSAQKSQMISSCSDVVRDLAAFSWAAT